MNRIFVIHSIVRSAAGVTVHLTTDADGSDISSVFMSEELWKNFKLRTGDTVSEDEYNSILANETLSKCISRALKILSSSDHSVKQLRKKLADFEFEDEVMAEAIEYVVSHNYLNEERQTCHLSEYYIRHKFWGKKRIAAELIMKGYSKEAILYAIDNIPEESYMKALHALMDRKYSMIRCEEEKCKLFSSLTRLGYSLSEIRKAIDELESGLIEV